MILSAGLCFSLSLNPAATVEIARLKFELTIIEEGAPLSPKIVLSSSISWSDIPCCEAFRLVECEWCRCGCG